MRSELRRNLIRRLTDRQPVFPGIRGYDDTVIPQLLNAILAGQDLVLLGERGQAKTRLLRGLVNLLDEAVPAIRGCEMSDDPYAPICRSCRELVGAHGDDIEIEWLTPDRRYTEKLATPDTSIADLIGDVDPIRVAEGRHLGDELTIHFGLIPRAHRGIFAINELPDLAERIQVGLLNVIEERDVQIRGYRVRLPVDVFLVATANPEDYTNRGRIITPLKDRFGAQVRTHYPTSVEQEMAIVESERQRFDGGCPVAVPTHIAEIIVELTHQARAHPQVNQRSGVSVRMSIANHESVIANALRRALALGERDAVVRVSDLEAARSSSLGRLEFEGFDDEQDRSIFDGLVQAAVLAVFRRHFTTQEFSALLDEFDRTGLTVETGALISHESYSGTYQALPGLERARLKLGEHSTPAIRAAVLEFVLEGLYLSKKLARTTLEATAIYGA